MRVSTIALAVALTGAVLAGNGFAQHGLGSARAGGTYRAYDTYYSQADDPASPSDAPAVASDEAAAPQAGGGCTTGCERRCLKPFCARELCGCPLDCAEREPWRLFGCNDWLACRGITVHGWIAGGATTNGQRTADRFNGPLPFNDRRDEFMMNQLYLVAEREADNGGCGLAWGGRLDLLYGTDYIFTQARGLETQRDFSPKWNAPGQHYGLAMPQLYIDLAYNDWLIRTGHFYTIIGYEVVAATGNFFYSHAYTHQYGEPFTHTGVLASRKLNDRWSFSAGLHRGWDNWETPVGLDRVSFLGGVTWTGPDENDSLAFALTSGDEETAVGGRNRSMYSLIYTRKLSHRATYVIEHDYGFQHRGSNEGEGNAEWYGINQYLFYQINCCWTAGMRLEWFRDHDGTRVTGVRDGNAIQGGSFPGNFWEITWGLNWRPARTDNIVVRPELRYDWYDGVGTPFNAGNSTDQFTAAFDVILLW